jgi:hypothetical protein
MLCGRMGHTEGQQQASKQQGGSMAGRYKVEDDRPGLIKCDNRGHRFGARARQKGHYTEDGSSSWVLDDERLRCERCSSPVRKVGTN